MATRSHCRGTTVPTRRASLAAAARRAVAAALLTSASIDAAAFGANNVAVLRLGSASVLTTGTALPVFVDEFDPVGLTVVQSIALDTGLCTLAVGNSSFVPPYQYYDQEGLPTLTADGGAITLGCYSVSATVAGTLDEVLRA